MPEARLQRTREAGDMDWVLSEATWIPPLGSTFLGYQILEADNDRPMRLRLDFGVIAEQAPRDATVTHSLIIKAEYDGYCEESPYFTLTLERKTT